MQEADKSPIGAMTGEHILLGLVGSSLLALVGPLTTCCGLPCCSSPRACGADKRRYCHELSTV